LITFVEPSQAGPDHRTKGMCTRDVQVCKVLIYVSAILRENQRRSRRLGGLTVELLL
jgi:hypothetical protein